LIPSLSVIVITPDNYGTIADVMRHLHAQENHQEIEIVICAPTCAALGPEPSEWKDFAAVQVLEIGDMRIIAQAKALAVKKAAAPIVAFAEEHSFPARGWARAFIERHREPHAVVGPVMVNPNPNLPVSWANFLIEYGPWMAPSAAGCRTHLPGNNSSYKRDVLLAFGDRLTAVLDGETLLQWELAAAGHSLFLEPRAATRHLNITRRSSFRRVHYQYGRMFASQRAASWSVFRRLLYGFGSPLIPLVRLRRHLPDVARNPKLPRLSMSFWKFVALGLFDSARGECVGYLTGPGDSREHVFELEFHRRQHLDPADSVPGVL
jgi:hypothetical protein